MRFLKGEIINLERSTLLVAMATWASLEIEIEIDHSCYELVFDMQDMSR